jgi:anaerobic magnesium-protoporphyrin IX monomethyl ester cyclase
MYECDYEFKEKSVEDLSEDINTFCLQSLKEIFNNRDQKNMEVDSCSYDENDLFSREMNEKLIEYFEDSLSAFENSEENALTTDLHG